MIKILIQFLFFLLLFCSNRKAKGRWFSSSGVLLAIYMVSAFCGMFALQIDGYTTPYRDSFWMSMLQFDLFLLLFLLPFRQYNEIRIRKICLPSRRFLDVFSTIVIVLSLYSLLFYAGSVRFIFSGDNLGYMRDAMVAGDEGYYESGVFATIGSVAAANYVFAIVLYFIYSIIGNSKTKCLLLLLSSVSEVVHVLAFVGRDGVVFWLFTFIFCYVFFQDFLPKQAKKRIMRAALLLASLIIIPFILITISRFGSSNVGSGGSIVSYLGHAFIQGPIFFDLKQKPFSPGVSFPLFYEITGLSRPNIRGAVYYGEWIPWKFSTFIVDFYINFSLGGLIAVGLTMFMLFKITVGRAKELIDLGQFTIYLLYYQIISQGVFYFRHYTRGGNLFIISTLILSLIFALKSKKGRNIVVLCKQ